MWGNEIKFQRMAQLGISFFPANRQNQHYTLLIASKTFDRFELGNSKSFLVIKYVIYHKSEKYMGKEVAFGSLPNKAEEAMKKAALITMQTIHHTN
jgi:hypothetical protein